MKNRRDSTHKSDDVVWQNVDNVLDSGDDIELQPLDPEVEAGRSRMRESDFPEPDIDSHEHAPKYQFTMRHMLIANTVLAISFAIMRVLAPSGFAGALGAVVFLGAILIAVYQLDSTIQKIWWAMVLLYVIVCAIAILT